MTEIRIPYRDRDESPLEALAWAGQLEGEEREVAEFQLEEVGLRLPRRFPTVGDLLDRIDGMSRSTRREVLDCARRSIGLESATAAASRRRIAASQPTGLQRDSEGRVLQRCAVCGVFPLSATGWPMPVDAKKWHCEQHIDQAAPGDMDPPAPRFVLSGSGQELPTGEEAERLRLKDEKQEEEERDDRERRKREAEVIKAARVRWERDHGDEQGVTVLGLKPSEVGPA